METKCPTGLQLTVVDTQFRDDPYPVLKKLRSAEPVHHDTELNRYFVSDYDSVKYCLRHRDYLSNPFSSKEDSFVRRGFSEVDSVDMLNADEPEHRRLRNLVNDIFSPKASEAWRDRIVQVIEQYLDDIPESEFDLIAEFARPVPTMIIAEMMGIPTEQHDDFMRWSDARVGTWAKLNRSDEDHALELDAHAELTAFFAQQIEDRRNHPGDDLISQMLAAEFDGHRLSDEDIIAQCGLLLIGGIATTTDMIGNGTKALLENPDQLALLRDKPELIEAAVEEILRYESPVQATTRITHDEVVISGCPVGKAEAMTLSIEGANRDPAIYTDPDRFDIERPSIPHQSFGGGRHYCLGVSLARIEGQEAILRLIQRFPDLSMSDRGCQKAESMVFRGLSHLWLNR